MVELESGICSVRTGMVSCGGEEPKMSSRELSTVGDASECAEVIVVAGDAGGDGVELESVCVEVMAWLLRGEVFMSLI